jgi:hypothetical protein
MDTLAALLNGLAIAAMVTVVAVLLLGIVSMAMGGEVNARWGNRLMCLRIIVQGIAIALLAGLAIITLSQN